MNLRILILNLFISAFWISSVTVTFAQDAFDHAQGFKAITSIKLQIAQLIEENNRLELEYSLLKEKFADVQRRYQGNIADLAELKKVRQQQEQIDQEREGQIKAVQSQLPDKESQVLVLNSQISFLNAQILEADERLRLLRLQAADKEYEKRDAQIGQKLQHFTHKEEVIDTSGELDRLKSIYEKSLQQEQQLLHEIDEMEASAGNAEVTTERLKQANKDIQTQIKQLEAQKKFRSEENALQRNKKLYQTRLMENQVWQHEQAKIALENRVGQLEGEFEKFNRQVDLSLNQQDQQRQLLDSLMQIDKENQQLKDQILDLQDKIKSLQ